MPRRTKKKRHQKTNTETETVTGALTRLDGQRCAELEPNMWLLLGDVQ